MTPGPNEQLSSDSATFGPYQTDTFAISTVASVANAGSRCGVGAGGEGGANGCISVPTIDSDSSSTSEPDQQHGEVDHEGVQPSVGDAGER